jgi:hypothetical protein
MTTKTNGKANGNVANLPAVIEVIEVAPNGEPAVIDYDDAVREGKQIIGEQKAAHDKNMRLGELAHGVEKHYGEHALKKYAEDIGATCHRTLGRYRSVYRAWMDAPKEAAPPSFAVAQDLQDHPDRFEIVRREPNITSSAARKYMKAYRNEHPEDDDDNQDPENPTPSENSVKEHTTRSESWVENWVGGLKGRAEKAAAGAERYGDWARFRDHVRAAREQVSAAAKAWSELEEYIEQLCNDTSAETPPAEEQLCDDTPAEPLPAARQDVPGELAAAA